MSAPSLAPAREVLYTIADVSAKLQASASEVYLVFDVKNQSGVKAKTSVLGPSGRLTAGETLELSIKEPVNATLEVQAFSKKTLLPDHTLGDFKLPLPQPGTAHTLGGTLLSKSGDKAGIVSFAISSGQASAPTTVAAPTTAAQSVPSASGAPLSSTSTTAAPFGHETTAEKARAGADQVAQKAAAKTNATALTAEGKTVDTINAVEQKLYNFKADLAHGPSHSQPSATQQASSAAGGQSAYSQAVGVPPEAGTASDAAGSGLAASAPHDATSEGPSGMTVGPVPTLQTAPGGAGSTTSAPGAEAGFGAKMRGAAVAAANMAEQALEAAKTRFVGTTPTAAPAPK